MFMIEFCNKNDFIVFWGFWKTDNFWKVQKNVIKINNFNSVRLGEKECLRKQPIHKIASQK